VPRERIEELRGEADDVRVLAVETADDQDLACRKRDRVTICARRRELTDGLPGVVGPGRATRTIVESRRRVNPAGASRFN